ncbi:MAG: right-handed parallel beta-helix repeat-containing protein, partial [Planctomycetota bacterium]
MYNHYGSPTVTNCSFSRNWSGWDGGGMYSRDSSKPTVTNCTFIGNAAKYGGGMYQRRNSNSTVTNCTFSGNYARTDGGGMFNYESSNPILTNCTFIENSAENTGGGMRNENFSSPVLTDCTFSNNSAGVCGGGMLSNSEISPLLTNCTFINNSSGMLGGGIYNGHSDRYDYSELTLMNCSFKGNRAAVNGGAIDNSDNTASTIVNCIFTGNVAGKSGGGISSWVNSRQTLTNCTFSGNSASNGGGMHNYRSSPTLTNCIFSENLAIGKYGDGAGMHNNESSSILTNCTFIRNKADRYGGAMNSYRYATPTLINCILWDDTPEEIYVYGRMPLVTYSNVQGGWPGQGNIDADPCFVQPDYFGPIAYWKFDETSGTTAYDSAGNNHGTVYGAQWTTGQVGGALSFDGADDYAGIAGDESLANVADNFTILLWAQPLSTHQIDPESNSGTSGTSGQKYAISARHGDYHWGSGHAGAGISIGTNGISVYEHAADYMPALLVWSGSVSGFNHVAVVYRDKQPRLYIDGESKKTGLQSSKTVHILSNIGGHRYGYFKGLIDDVRFYDRA